MNLHAIMIIRVKDILLKLYEKMLREMKNLK